MYVTMSEMIVIMDTLRASGNIADGGNVFGYIKDTRMMVHDLLAKRLDLVKIGVQEREDDHDQA